MCKSSLAMEPELDHAMYLLLVLLALHIADRQVTSISKLHKLVKIDFERVFSLFDRLNSFTDWTLSGNRSW